MEISQNKKSKILPVLSEGIIETEALTQNLDRTEQIVICKKDFADMLFSVQHPLRSFKKAEYEHSFFAYMQAHRLILETVSTLYRQEQYSEIYKEIATYLLEEVQAHMQGQKKRTKAKMLTEYNLVLVIYVFPAFLQYDKMAGQAFIREVLHQWKENFMQTNLKAATFEEINAGFEKAQMHGI